MYKTTIRFNFHGVKLLWFPRISSHGVKLLWFSRGAAIHESFICENLDQSGNKSVFGRQLHHKNANMAVIL